MKKINYKAINVNKLDWSSMQTKFNNQDVIFSIDVAKTAFVGLLVNEDQDVYQLIKWSHPQDTEELVNNIHTCLGAARLTVVMEPTGTYGDALRWQFIKRGIPVYRVNPKHTHDQSETFDGVPSSHDAKAAYIIADLHRRNHSEIWQENTIEQRNLRGLVNELEIYQTVHRANLNRLSALLIRHWPELEEVISLNTVSALTMLSTFGDPDNILKYEDQIDELLRHAGRAGLKPDKRQAIIQSAHNSLGMPCTECERDYIKNLTKDLLRTHKASKEVEKRMAEILKEHEELTEIIQLCGRVTSVVLTAILGDLRNYPNAKSLLKATGLNLKEHSSGQKKGQLKITKRGSGKVRFYLYWLVLRLLNKDACIQTWYKSKVSRDGGRGKGRAIVAIMRKIVKALWYVAQGQVFDSRKLFNLDLKVVAA
jgi:transposase